MEITKEEQFHSERILFYIDEYGQLITDSRKHSTHTAWFNFINKLYIDTIRGYKKDDYVMIYINDFETPELPIKYIQYLFELYPQLKWIGLGCNKGKIGEVWTPKLKITRP